MEFLGKIENDLSRNGVFFHRCSPTAIFVFKSLEEIFDLDIKWESSSDLSLALLPALEIRFLAFREGRDKEMLVDARDIFDLVQIDEYLNEAEFV